MKQPESHPWRKGFPPRQLCELCGERPATHTVAVERTIGGSGDPEVDVEVERQRCDWCAAEADVLLLMKSWPRIDNGVHAALAARCWGATLKHGLEAMAQWLDDPEEY